MTKTHEKRFALGVDYGTNNVRAMIVDVTDGSEIASATFDYPSGESGVLVDSKNPLLARQNPQDYLDGFVASVSKTVKAAKKNGFKKELLVGIGVDTTGSTPIPVDRQGRHLSSLKPFTDEPAAHAWLWKDHTSYAEAAEITEAAAKSWDRYLAKCGGTYSSEWFWSKALHCKRENSKVFKAAFSWVEQCDFIPAYLTGNTDPMTMPRSICAAGHKAMYHESWGGLPRRAFLEAIDPDLAVIRDHYADHAVTSDQMAGGLTEDLARKTGLLPGTPVAVGVIDAHAGAVGAGIKPGTLVKIMGTSTCDMMVHPLSEPLADVPGLCGIVPGSIVPGMYGLEAGQAAVGDIFNWFVKNLVPERYSKSGDVHANLTREAEKLRPGESGLLALDWNNGNRTVLVDPLLTGLLVGTTLHTTAPEVYRTLIEATAFGALTIINRFEQYGVKVREVVNCGGIAEKSPMTMQIYADICNRPMKISRSAQTCALGAAIFGAVVGGVYRDVPSAQRKMTGVKEIVYRPNRKAVAVYSDLYGLYMQLHDAFGTTKYSQNLFDVMKILIRTRDAVQR